MDWQAALRARGIADGPLASLIGQRFDWGERKQGDPLPGVALLIVSDGREQHLKGFQGYQPSRVQVDSYGRTHKEAWAVTNAALDAVVPSHTGNGHVFSRAMVDLPPRDIIERQGDKTIFRVSMDLTFHHAAADEEDS